MPFPMNLVIKIPLIFGENDINITLYSGLTTFVGPNGSGKTQVMKHLKNHLGGLTNGKKVRYLSSNRVGPLEQFRSQTTQYGIQNNPTIGDRQSLQNRHVIEVATGDFLAMDARKDIYIKVSERLRVLFKRDIYLRWDSGNLTIFFGKTGLSTEYSISAEASGLINLISILAAIYDDEVGALLIDEPEVSLHPQLQAFILREIKNVAGDPIEQGKKIIVMATHSIDMLDIRSADELPNFVFFSEDRSLPKQINNEAGELKSTKIKELIPRLGQAHKSAFFAKQPLLVEGISDSLFCIYFDERYNLYLGVAGTQIVPVDGKGQFAAVTKLMRMIGKSPVVLADLDAYTDDNYLVDLFAEDEVTKEEASSRGHKDLPAFVRDVKTDFCNLCDKNWEDVKHIFEIHPYWKNRRAEDDSNVFLLA
ncbi:MAG: AAA family ATPase [Desulfitobacteriaceae bacterium]|nr:AAA family ATPase [Desulfitobacteriaceae bacterium]MDI6915304.1 AAA family ATPase [Desulfitobacteriaceae bacterium]